MGYPRTRAAPWFHRFPKHKNRWLPGQLAVRFDAVSSGVGTGTTVTVPHTCSGTNRVLIVDAVLGNSPDNFTLSATYNGVAMTSLGLRHSNNNTAGFIEKFILINPAVGTNDIVVTRSAGTITSLIVGGISFTGASQNLADYTGNFFSATGDSAAPSVAVTDTASTSLVQDGACNGHIFSSVGADQTQRWNINDNTGTAAGNGAGSTEPGNGGTVTMSWTVTTDWWAIQAVEILVAGAATALVIQNSQQAQIAQAVTLVPTLQIQNSQQAQTTQAVTLVPNLVIQNSQQAQTTQVVTLVPTLQVQNSQQAQTTQAVTLVPNLVIQNSQQAQTAQAVTLVPTLQIQNSQQAQATQNVVLTSGGVNLVIQNSQQAQTTQSVTLGVTLAIQNSQQAQTTTSPNLAPTLTIQNSQQAQTTQSVTLAPSLTIQNSQQAQTTTSLTLSPHLVIQNSSQVQTAQNVTFTPDVIPQGWGIILV